MTAVNFSAAAPADLHVAQRYYAERSPQLGARFAAEIDRAVAQIVVSPTAWRQVSPRLRRFVVRGFPYLVLFRDDGSGGVLIAGVAHQRQDAARWRQR